MTKKERKKEKTPVDTACLFNAVNSLFG
jgi:hypothetical protein